MKLLYLVHQYFPRWVGGTEVYTRGLVRRAVRAGHQVEVVTYHDAPSRAGPVRTEFEGVPLVEMHDGLGLTPHPARYEFDNPDMFRWVRAEIERFRPDVVHAMHSMKLSGAALEACEGIPRIVTLCDFWFLCPRHTLLTWDGKLCDGPRDCGPCLKDLHGFRKPDRGRTDRLREIVLRADRIIALSDFMKLMFVKNGYPAERIEVLDHGLETAGLAPSPPEGPRLLFIGNRVPHKGTHILEQALRGTDWDARFYGSGQTMGTFPPDEMGRILKGAAVLAVPALWYENNPLVLKAALHVGIPVLASRIGCLPEWIREGENGWLAEPGDVADWSRKLRVAREQYSRIHGRGTPVKSMDQNFEELLGIYSSCGPPLGR